MTEIKKITEQTLVPISLLAIFLGGAFFVSNIYNSVETLKKDYVQQRNESVQKSRDTDEKFDKIMLELYYLKGAMSTKEQKKGD